MVVISMTDKHLSSDGQKPAIVKDEENVLQTENSGSTNLGDEKKIDDKNIVDHDFYRYQESLISYLEEDFEDNNIKQT